MSEITYNYFNKLDSLDLFDLKILLDRIKNLIILREKNSDSEIEEGLAFFNSQKGSIDRDINIKEELSSALDEKYAYFD